jgi:hypothetical protein
MMRQREVRTLRARMDLYGFLVMELIAGSVVATVCLLLGHFAVLVRNRLLGTQRA